MDTIASQLNPMNDSLIISQEKPKKKFNCFCIVGLIIGLVIYDTSPKYWTLA